MDKVRIRDLAKELGMETSKEILAFLERIGAKGKSASSNLEGDLIERVKAHFKKPAPLPPPPRTTTVTRSDGVLERRSQKVILRRGAPALGGTAAALVLLLAGCSATREAFWSVHVEPAIDPKRSDVILVNVSDRPDGRHGTLVITPRDSYGNPLGPGRGDRFTVSPAAGVKVTGPVQSCGATGSW